METIISGIISAGAAIIVCVITQTTQARKTEALLSYKLDELTKRVDKHNNVIERTYKLEEQTAVQEEQIKVANHRIEDLEEAMSIEKKKEEKDGDLEALAPDLRSNGCGGAYMHRCGYLHFTGHKPARLSDPGRLRTVSDQSRLLLLEGQG